MNDFRKEPKEVRSAEIAAVTAVLDSGWYVLGKQVEEFEADWSRICRVTHTVGVANGLDAIEIGLRSLDIGPGDEVITTPMTAVATVLAIVRAGAQPVLADIDPCTALLDPASVARCITQKTKAILLVHLYGQVRQMDAWVELCHGRGIALLEDCAQAHLAEWKGRRAGTFGAFGAYSFYPTKNLGAIGDAGALVCSDDTLASCARMIRNYGQSTRYHHPVFGMNSRLDELQAAILMVRLSKLESWTARRREIATAYREGISNPSVAMLALPEEENSHVHHLIVLVCNARDRLAAELRAAGIQTLVHYPIPAHRQPPFTDVLRDPLGLRNAEDHAARCLSIPCHPQLADLEIREVIEAVNRFV